MRIILLTLIALTVSACATASSAEARPDRNTITSEQFRSHHSTAFDVVQGVRPQWLRQRGVDSFQRPSQIQVYLDGVRMGGPATLRSIPVDSIRRIQYLSANDATQRFGLDHASGAIVVHTR